MRVLFTVLDWELILKYSMAESAAALITSEFKDRMRDVEIKTGIVVHNYKMSLLIGMQRFALENFCVLAKKFEEKTKINIATADGLQLLYRGATDEKFKILYQIQKDLFGEKDECIEIDFSNFSDRPADRRKIALPDLLDMLPCPPFSRPLPKKVTKQEIIFWNLKNVVAGFCCRSRNG